MRRIFLFLIMSILLLTVGCSKTTTYNNTKSLTENEENISSREPENSNIYGFVESNANWAVDPTPENLLSDSYSVLKIKVDSIENAQFIDNLNYKKPFTPINVEVITVLAGENISGNITIYTIGGDVLLSEVIKHQPSETTEKMGLNKTPQSVKDSTYIKYSSDHDYSFEVDKEYVVILDKQDNNIYTVAANGYGIFNCQNYMRSTDETFTNVLSGEKLNL